MRPLLPALAAFSALAIACASGGEYGFSRIYSPLDAEAAAIEPAVDYDPVMVRRLPQDWKGKPIRLFGVVVSRSDGDDGKADVLLSVRRLAARNLCESGDEESCRVTVSDKEIVRVHALMALTKAESVGTERLRPGSLLRLVGVLHDQPDKEDGTDVFVVDYHRHWPPRFFVTEQARSYMRR